MSSKWSKLTDAHVVAIRDAALALWPLAEGEQMHVEIGTAFMNKINVRVKRGSIQTRSICDMSVMTLPACCGVGVATVWPVNIVAGTNEQHLAFYDALCAAIEAHTYGYGRILMTHQTNRDALYQTITKRGWTVTETLNRNTGNVLFLATSPQLR